MDACILDVVRGGFNNPRHGNFPLKGYPPPGPPRTRFSRKVSGNFLTEKGVPPPPLTDDPLPKTEFCVPKTAFFGTKNTVFGLLFNRFFLTVSGPPPQKKVNGKKLTEMGGTPPPLTESASGY